MEAHEHPEFVATAAYFETGEGQAVADTNHKLVAAIGCMLEEAGRPFVLGADFNQLPRELAATGIEERLHEKRYAYVGVQSAVDASLSSVLMGTRCLEGHVCSLNGRVAVAIGINPMWSCSSTSMHLFLLILIAACVGLLRKVVPMMACHLRNHGVWLVRRTLACRRFSDSAAMVAIACMLPVPVYTPVGLSITPGQSCQSCSRSTKMLERMLLMLWVAPFCS